MEPLSSVSLIQILDIAVVSLLIYIALVFIRQTRSYFIFVTIVLLASIFWVSKSFGLTLTETIFRPFLAFLAIIIVIVFQREIRRFIEWFSLSGRKFALSSSRAGSHTTIQSIVTSVKTLAKTKVGALIVLPGDHPLDHSTEGGITLNGAVSVPLLLSLFDSSSPGHDGAAIIKTNRVTRFGVHLPLTTQNGEGLTKYGTRHRAAMGLTEETDALVIIVSEERGAISVARNGALREVTLEKCEQVVSDFYSNQSQRMGGHNAWRELLFHNWILKLASIFFAVILWFTLL